MKKFSVIMLLSLMFSVFVGCNTACNQYGHDWKPLSDICDCANNYGEECSCNIDVYCPVCEAEKEMTLENYNKFLLKQKYRTELGSE